MGTGQIILTGSNSYTGLTSVMASGIYFYCLTSMERS